MAEFTRRSLLAAAGVALTAGCLTDSGDGPGGESTTTATTVFDGTTTPRPDGETPRTESRERKTTRTTSETTTGDWIEHASNQPDPDHAITLANEADESETVRVRIERDATGATVFETTETVDPGHEFTAYNLKQADPEGVEVFSVCAELVDSPASTESATATAETATADSAPTWTTAATERTTADTERTTAATERMTRVTELTTTASERRSCTTLRTNECYADAHVTVREDGSLRIIYAIC